MTTVLEPGAVPAGGTRPRSTPATDLLEGLRDLRRLRGDGPDRPFERFGLTPVGMTLGAEIRGVDLSQPLDADVEQELHRALLEWKVLFFPGQDLTSDAQRAFARRWGTLETNPQLTQGDDPSVTRFAKGGGGAPTYENIWHADTTFRPNPGMGAVLRMVQTPPRGGDTMWADMAVAYDNLSDAVKSRIEGAEAVHDMVPGFSRFMPADQLEGLKDMFPPVTHPVVRTHPETGRRTLYVNAAFTTEIVGMDREESDVLLRHLFAQAHVPEYQVRFRWTEGTVAFWDNRATQHYAVGDYHPHVRVAERVSVQGDRPF